MASNKIPWNKLWPTLWNMIPDPLSDGRLLLVLDDFINPKTGKNIFGCSHIFDHAAKANQSKYPWAQNVVLVGLLKRIKGRWACLPLAHRFYLPKKAILAKLDNMKIPGKDSSFQTKLEQAAKMVIKLAQHFVGANVTVVCDSWFGNNGLFKSVYITGVNDRDGETYGKIQVVKEWEEKSPTFFLNNQDHVTVAAVKIRHN